MLFTILLFSVRFLFFPPFLSLFVDARTIHYCGNMTPCQIRLTPVPSFLCNACITNEFSTLLSPSCSRFTLTDRATPTNPHRTSLLDFRLLGFRVPRPVIAPSASQRETVLKLQVFRHAWHTSRTFFYDYLPLNEKFCRSRAADRASFVSS